MMEKTLILKHISRMLCLLISYSKFTRTPAPTGLYPAGKCDVINMMPGSKGLNPYELAHKWVKDLRTRPDMSIKVG